METVRKSQESKNPSLVTSQTSNGMVQIQTSLPINQIPISRSDTTNPYPTTFVQADASTFKQVVQMLTGSAETAKQASSPRPTPTTQSQQDYQSQATRNNFPIPPIKTTPKKQQGNNNNSFKLYERRNYYSSSNNNNNNKTSLMINTLLPSGFQVSSFSPRNKPEILSPSMLDFPKLTLSPVTPLNEDPFNKISPFGNSSTSSEEERAIAEKGFYLHPSPISTPRDSEPQLLPLFPLTSPRVSESST